MELSATAFEPKHQPLEGKTVVFKLQPLDLKGQYELQASMDDRMVPSWDGIQVAARYVVGWEGMDEAFSRARLRQILAGGASLDWMIWLAQIAGELYRGSLLSEIERKN